jgi:pyruvate ferredoxin oxidoreductase gamma subunit
MMFQVRIHGRGGQGVVTAAEMLSIAGFREDRHTQAFPSFGSERMGAPVMAFCRFDDRPIRLREPVMTPDALIIQDTTLLHQVTLFEGISDQGYVLINSSRNPAELGLDEFFAEHPLIRFLTVPATRLAQEYVGRPVPNAALLGGFAALTGLIRLGSVEAAIEEKFSGRVAAGNIAAARAAFDAVDSQHQTEPAC